MTVEWVVAVNPAAGRRAVSPDRVRRALAEAGIEAVVETPPDPAAMRRLIETAATVTHLAVVGGDGTVGHTVDTLIGTGSAKLPVLGVLPAGSGCDLLRTFGIPQHLETSAHHLRGDQVYEIDIGELVGEWGTRRFVNVAQAGVGAAAAATAARLPRLLGAHRYPAAFGLRLPLFPHAEIELTTERRTHRGRALAVIFANGQFFAGGWNIAPKAMLVDGALDLQVIDSAKMSAPRLVPRIVRGLHLADPGVRRMSAGGFRLETDHPWPVEADGDVIGNTPVEGRVLAAAIRLKI